MLKCVHFHCTQVLRENGQETSSRACLGHRDECQSQGSSDSPTSDTSRKFTKLHRVTPLVLAQYRKVLPLTTLPFMTDAIPSPTPVTGNSPSLLSRQIHDDFLVPIRLLFNNRQYVASLRLLFQMVDAVIYLDGDDDDVYPDADAVSGWLTVYVDLASLYVSANDLIVLRDSLRPGFAALPANGGRIRLILPSALQGYRQYQNRDEDRVWLEPEALIRAFSTALGEWLAHTRRSSTKLNSVELRYRSIIADSTLSASS
ncbi:hypothetical protein OKW29_005595 [Paraburkholderia sp. CI3]